MKLKAKEEKKLTSKVISEAEEYKLRTKGRFYETVHASGASHFKRDQSWIRQANPEYVMVQNSRN
jgi:hypothetical protein